MLRWIDGFDHYMAIGQTGATVQKYLEAAGYVVRNASATTFAIAEGRQAGQGALQFSVAANASVVPSISYGYSPATATKVVFGFALKATGARMRVCRVESVIDLNWNATSGKLEATYSGQTYTGASVLILNAWYFIEVVVDVANDTVTVYANNELQLTQPFAEAMPSPVTITWGQTATQSAAGVQLIDDFYILDNNGGVRVDRVGPAAVATRRPSADVTTQWAIVPNGTTPAPTTHFSVAGQLGALETNKPYLQSNINGDKDEFKSNDLLPNNNQIYGVGVVALARKGDLDQRSLGLYMKVSGTESEVQVALTESNKYLQATLETPPGGGDWSQNIVEASSFGIITR